MRFVCAGLGPRRLAALLLAGTCLSSPAWATDIPVTDDTTLRNAITTAVSGDRIVFQNSITLSSDLPAVQTNVTIDGGSNTLSGNGLYRGLFVGAFSGATQVPVAVTVQNLDIANTKAQGGAGGNGQRGAGGGAGLGGALFVASGANLTVSNVNLTGNNATGGQGGNAGGSGGGGGGGLGGAGGNGNATGNGGGGGVGFGANGGASGAAGANGIATGAASGGAGGGIGSGAGGTNGGGGGGAGVAAASGGGGGVGGNSGATNGNGGFGGGGGGSANGAGGSGGVGGGGGGGVSGGTGGFGGGGGGAAAAAGAGTSNFGGGRGGFGGTGGGGGGGLGAGGAIFVQQGGNLSVTGSLTVNGNTVAGGARGNGAGGATAATNGSAFGAGIFLGGNGTLTFGAGTQTVSNVIADQSGSGAPGSGSWNVTKNGAGTTTTLSANNTYSGGTTVTAGTLQIGVTNALSTTGALTVNGGTFDLNNRNQTVGNLSGTGGTISLGSGTLTAAGASNTTLASQITGGGSFSKAGIGTLTLTGANTYTNGTTIAAGRLQLGVAGGASGSIRGAVTVSGFGSLEVVNTDLSGVTTITNNSAVNFLGGNSAAGVTIQNNNQVAFSDSSTAGSATIVNNAFLSFFTASSAGSAAITNNGILEFNNNSTAGNAAITTGAALTRFLGSASGGTASFVTNAGGGVDFSNITVASITAGSIAGAGTYFLGARNLIVGGNNSSTTVDGTIEDGGSGGGTGGSLTKVGTGTLTLSGANTYTGGTTISAGTLAISSDSNLGGAGGGLAFNGGTLQFINVGPGVTTARAITLNAGGGTFQTDNSATLAGAISGSGGLIKTGGLSLTLTGSNSYTGGTTITDGTLVLGTAGATARIVGAVTNGASLAIVNADTTGITSITNTGFALGTQFANASSAGTMTISNNNGANTLFLDNSSAGNATIVNNGGAGSGLLAGTIFGGTSTAGTATIVTNSGGVTLFGQSATGGQARFITNAGGIFDISQIAPAGTTAGSIEGAGIYNLGSKQLTVGSNNLSTTVSGIISDNIPGITADTGGSLVKVGGGTLTLSGNNTYSGGTTVTGGLINFSALGNFGSGMITLNGGGLQWAAGNTTDISSRLVLGASGAIFDTGGNTVALGSALTGTGGITKQGDGILNLTATNTYSGPTTVSGGTLAVNGSISSNVTVGAAGTLGGNGVITGSVVNAGTLAPGNSIGTLTVNGSFTQAAGSTYRVEANAAGQADRINVTGAPGTATLQGGTVQVLAQAGSYGKSTTYTILNATGGVSGTYANVTSNFAFLTPSLAYDANNVFLTLAIAQNAFSFAGRTPNQKAVGVALDQSLANASGDFAAVLGVMVGLDSEQGPQALHTISGQPYADFGTMNVNNSALFMNALGQQMANARGAASAGQRQALAQACEIESCDAMGPLSAWFSALGGLGSVLGDTNASTLTYNFGGAAAGIDYRLDPRFLVGLGVGYTHGTQWVNSFMGQGWTDSVSVAAYGSFTQGGFYLDALAGYATFNNQLQRQILIPGLQQRTATGSTGANQFLGQIEAGYKVGVYAPAAATITPFGRFQISSVTQNAFSESGAQSLSLNVAQQTTNSQRTTIGADLGSSIGLGNERKLDLAVRLGWMHEFADVARPITAAFAGAPGNSFTVFGATPLRNAAVVGLQATTTIAAATQIYLRYDGEIATGTDNHALNIGVRMSW
jgi:fibronectin-binding autotransporter adhesin